METIIIYLISSIAQQYQRFRSVQLSMTGNLSEAGRLFKGVFVVVFVVRCP
jgi:hypothetical protein